MTIEELRQAIMQRRIKQKLAVFCAMPDQEPITLYFTKLETCVDFVRRARLNGGTAKIVAP